MPRDNYKSITIKGDSCEKLDLSSQKVNFLLKKKLEEQEKLRKFASKIKKYPLTVRVYTNSFMSKREGSV